MAKVKIVMNHALERAVDRAVPETLVKAAQYVQRVARASIFQKINPNVASPSGTPIYAHAHSAKRSKTGRSNPGFKRTILYARSERGNSILVGPKLVRAGLTSIAATHEFGGTRKINAVDPAFKHGFEIGEIGPVITKYVKKRDVVYWDYPRPDPKNGEKVVWIRLRTKKQMQHSNRLYARIISTYKGTPKMVNYPARPYMRPALARSTPKLSHFWSNVVH